MHCTYLLWAGYGGGDLFAMLDVTAPRFDGDATVICMVRLPRKLAELAACNAEENGRAFALEADRYPYA